MRIWLFALCLSISSAASAAAIFLEKNPFKPASAVRTTPTKFELGPNAGKVEWELVAVVPKTPVAAGVDPVFMAVRVSISYFGEWRFYDSANFYGGASAQQIGRPSRSVLSCNSGSVLYPSGCNLYEQVAYKLPRDYDKFLSSDGSGISIQIAGAHPVTFTIPAELLKEVWRQADEINAPVEPMRVPSTGAVLQDEKGRPVDPCAKHLLPSDRPPECARQ